MATRATRGPTQCHTSTTPSLSSRATVNAILGRLRTTTLVMLRRQTIQVIILRTEAGSKRMRENKAVIEAVNNRKATLMTATSSTTEVATGDSRIIRELASTLGVTNAVPTTNTTSRSSGRTRKNIIRIQDKTRTPINNSTRSSRHIISRRMAIGITVAAEEVSRTRDSDTTTEVAGSRVNECMCRSRGKQSYALLTTLSNCAARGVDQAACQYSCHLQSV